MIFLRHRLEEITSHKLEIIPMCDFVNGLCTTSSQATKERSLAFFNKWKDDVYQKSLKLAYISGSWTPASLGTKELRFQRPWNEYLRQNFFTSLGSTTIGKASGSFKPLNFKELVQMPYWKEFYKIFGQKAISFLFEKSMIIEEVEESFYLVISSDCCTLRQKLSKAISGKRTASAIDVHVCENVNPYQLLKGEQNVEILSNSKPENTNKRRRLMSQDLSEEFNNKAKIEIDNIEIIPQTGSPKPKRDDCIPVNSQGVVRWFIPADKVLKFVIEEREKLKAKSGVASVVHNVAAKTKEVNYIGILQDDHFLKIGGQDLRAIVKQSCKITFPLKKLPPQWEGLNISELVFNSNTVAYVNVFKISETFAKDHEIRIKSKQRRRKKLDNVEFQLPQTVQTQDDSKDTTDRREFDVPGQSNASHFNPVLPNSKIFSGKSFDPFMPLETLPALYNKTSWSRWPSNHIITAACNAGSHNDGSKLLFEKIFATSVGASINNAVSQTLLSSDVKALSSILGDILLFHKRMKDFHNLVKSCLTFWMIKKQNKVVKRELAKVERHKYKSKRKTMGPAKNKIDKSIEVIDLTTDTPSTANPSPDLFSNSHHTSVSGMEVSINATYIGNKSAERSSLELKLKEQNYKQQRRAFAYAKLKEKVPYTCLIMCIKQIFRISKIEQLLGSKKNIRGFFTFLRKSVILAGTKSSLHLGQLMALLDPSDCQWLSSVENPSHKCAILAKIAKWLFSDYVLVILKTSFYITEISDSRLHACFYLRESWKSISEHMKHRFTQSGVLRFAGTMPSRKIQVKRSNDSINARIRFIPKANHDLRPILSLKRQNHPLNTVKKWTMVINHLVRQRSPHRVRDTNTIRQKWLQFLQYWKMKGQPKLYFVRADIQDAYPSVDMSKLKEVLLNSSQDLGVLVSKDFRVFSTSRVVLRQTLMSESDRNVWNSSILIRPCIVQETDQREEKLDAVEIAKQIVSCFKKNVVRFGKHRYSFDNGLPQGWRLSEGLCNVYYGNMDAKYFSEFLSKKGEFLITSVDDYLFITSDPNRASKFYKKMLAGMPDYRCKSNDKKIFSNIHPRSDISCCEQECEWVNFCGWKFCLTCGHMMRDFHSYKNQDMTSTLSFNPGSNVTSPENFLINRMKVMLPARLHYFLLDPAINCKERIILNIYEAGLIFAFRFYAICRVVFPNLNAVKEPNRAVYIVSSIYGCTKILSRMIVKVFHHTYPAKPTPSGCKMKGSLCPCIKPYIINAGSDKLVKNMEAMQINPWMDNPLEEAEIFYIVYHAFILKIKKHSQVFKDEVLPKLHKMKHFQTSLLSQEKVQFLINVLGNRMPSHFEDIKI